MTLVKEQSKADFIAGVGEGVHLTGVGTTAAGFCGGGEVGLNSEYKTGKWGFTATEQGGGRGWKITRRKQQE